MSASAEPTTGVLNDGATTTIEAVNATSTTTDRASDTVLPLYEYYDSGNVYDTNATSRSRFIATSPPIPISMSRRQSVSLDREPVVSQDFEWNEQHALDTEAHEMTVSPEGTTHAVSEPVADGMASLTTTKSEAGYL